MESIEAARHPETEERDAIRTDLRNALNVITGRAQLLQRQLLRADGLLNLERDQMLDGLAATLADVRRMSLRLEDLLVERPPQVALPGGSPLGEPDMAVVSWDDPISAPAQDPASGPD